MSRVKKSHKGPDLLVIEVRVYKAPACNWDPAARAQRLFLTWDVGVISLRVSVRGPFTHACMTTAHPCTSELIHWQLSAQVREETKDTGSTSQRQKTLAREREST